MLTQEMVKCDLCGKEVPAYSDWMMIAGVLVCQLCQLYGRHMRRYQNVNKK